jgi:adenylyltransferase/sulfurtransferase
VVASVIGAVQAQEAMKLKHKEEIRQGMLTSLCGKMFYYEGQHLTSRLIEHRGWDDDCPVHEKWDPITTHSTLTCRHTLAEAMELLGEHLGDCDIEIVLRNQAWVDYIEQKNDDSKVDVMLPESKVAQFLTDVKGMKLEEADGFYQHEFRILGADFPYGGMTLQQLGIPDMDVLHVRTGKGEHFVELACTDSAAQTEHNQERTKEQ